MNMNDGGLPTLYEELNRKSMETLEMLIRKRDQGKLNDTEFGVGVEAVFSCVAGLASQDVSEVIEACKTEVKVEPFDKRGFYKQGQPLVVVVWLKARDKVVFRRFDLATGTPNDTYKDFTKETIPSQAAKDYMVNLINGLKDKGFKQVM